MVKIPKWSRYKKIESKRGVKKAWRNDNNKSVKAYVGETGSGTYVVDIFSGTWGKASNRSIETRYYDTRSSAENYVIGWMRENPNP